MSRARKALFPISLGNDRFSSEMVIPAIGGVLDRYSDVIVLIADRLQIYNHVSAAIAGQVGTAELAFSFSTFEAKIDKTLAERERWIDKIKDGVGPAFSHVRWQIASLATFCDRRAFEVLRRVLIMYEIDPHFRSDINSWADQYVERRYNGLSPANAAQIRGLSVRYILEEAALSIRIRVFKRIGDELYMGETTEPIARIYWGMYSKGVWELAGLKAREFKFSFHEYSRYGAETGFWKELNPQ